MEFFKDDKLKISVRNLVEFILRSGDLDNRSFGKMDSDAMLQGSKAHRKLQKEAGLDYKAEVPLRIDVQKERFTIIVEGRADGIVDNDKGLMIEEIKGTNRDVYRIEEPVYVHKAQAMCYAYMYGMSLYQEMEEHKDCKPQSVRIRMTYINLDSEEIKQFVDEYDFDFISGWFLGIVDEYFKWADFMYTSMLFRNRSATELQFPFEYREGQRDIVVAVYKSITRQKELFIQAPTGIGKTMSVIFPAIKSIGENKSDKIFYLTAKTIAGTVAEQAFELLRTKGLHFRNIMLTAKEKMCVADEVNCNPDACPRAAGHYDRINDAVYDVITNEKNITRDIIKDYAAKHNVCPFELSLDVSNWVDGIICDYNYAFDPHASLKRYFADGNSGEYILLVDEAHNLVDRARDMFSAVLVKEDILEAKRIVNKIDPRTANKLEKINKVMLSMKRQCDEFVVLDDLFDLPSVVSSCITKLATFFEEQKKFEDREKVLDIYFRLMDFSQTYEMIDGDYKMFSMIDSKGDFIVKLLCVNPSKRLKENIDKCISTVMFSATLLPIMYYKELLTGCDEDYAIYALSPFEQQKRLLLAGVDVSSRYTKRNEQEYSKIYRYIKAIIEAQNGNYMVFFPSYRFMQDVYASAVCNGMLDIAYVEIQQSSMNEQAREEFLKKFDEAYDKPFVAFCIMGGIFSEGIDLTEDKLIGTIIIGTGLPKIGKERDLIMEYFEEKGKNGFDYAYRYPGMNKVMQAAGRVIRTKDDVGVIALLDDRFAQNNYKSLFPKEWDDCVYVTENSLDHQVKDFWRRL